MMSKSNNHKAMKCVDKRRTLVHFENDELKIQFHFMFSMTAISVRWVKRILHFYYTVI